MIDYIKMFKLENQFVLNEHELECTKVQAKRVVQLLTNDLWPISYGQPSQRNYLHQADQLNFVTALQWAKAVVRAEAAGQMDDYETLQY